MPRTIKPLEYVEPQSIAELFEHLGSKSSAIFAGGVDLVLNMRLRIDAPKKLVSIRSLPDFDAVEVTSTGSLRIGALATLTRVERTDMLASEWSALHEAIRTTGTPQVRNMGTLVGNLCAASPLTDIAPALQVFGATALVSSALGKRSIPVEALITGQGKTTLNRGEIVTHIEVPPPAAGSGSAFTKFLKTPRTNDDLPKVAVAAMVEIEDGRCSHAAICLGGVAVAAKRAGAAEDVLVGQQADETVIRDAAFAAAQSLAPLTDVEAVEIYRRDLAQTLVGDTLATAFERAVASGGGA